MSDKVNKTVNILRIIQMAVAAVIGFLTSTFTSGGF